MEGIVPLHILIRQKTMEPRAESIENRGSRQHGLRTVCDDSVDEEGFIRAGCVQKDVVDYSLVITDFFDPSSEYFDEIVFDTLTENAREGVHGEG